MIVLWLPSLGTNGQQQEHATATTMDLMMTKVIKMTLSLVAEKISVSFNVSSYTRIGLNWITGLCLLDKTLEFREKSVRYKRHCTDTEDYTSFL